MGKSISAIYIWVLLLCTALLCAYNIGNGFGEDSDSVRMVEAAHTSFRLHQLLPSRSWGYPLYEACVYPLIYFFSPHLLPAKMLSLLLVLGTAWLMFGILRRLQLSASSALLLGIIFVCHPLVIIAGNAILETCMSLFFVVWILYYTIGLLLQQRLTLANYLCYGVLFGLATLARPDNMLYFPSLFILLLLRRRLNIAYTLASGICLLAIGIVPYFLVHYPLFQKLASNASQPLLRGIKDIIGIFGLFLIAALAGWIVYFLSRSRAAWQKAFRWKDDVFLFTSIFSVIVLARVMKMSDELEYGLAIWPLFIILLALLVRELSSGVPARTTNVFMASVLVATLLPNFIQVYFFREVNFEYKFSPGLTAGVFKQEKKRRVLNEEIYRTGIQVLEQASDSLRNKSIDYKIHLLYDPCDSCVVLTGVRDLKLYKKTSHGRGTDLAHHRIVFSPDFNISRGWRNFIRDSYIPPFSEKHLVLQY